MKPRRRYIPTRPITWDERYQRRDYYYGTEPNEFFARELSKLKPGKILLIGEGEGRNAVFAASKGWKVDAIDSSLEAQKKAFVLAMSRKVSVNYIISNFFDYQFADEEYDAIGLIFFHVPSALRKRLFEKIRRILKSGGVIISEVFEKEQLGRPSGGPREADMLYDSMAMIDLADGMKARHLAKETVMLNEGEGHRGEAIVMRLVAEKK